MPLPTIPEILGGGQLAIELAGEERFEVRAFEIEEALSAPFTVRLTVVSRSPDVDFGAIVGHPARFSLSKGRGVGPLGKVFTGLVSQMDQVEVEDAGLSSYTLSLVPTLWLLGQRRNYRMFQQQSELEIALALLREWDIECDVRLDPKRYKPRKYRVQYAETDLAFLCRMLEDAGITFFFETEPERGRSRLVLSGEPHAQVPRLPPLPFVASPNERIEHEFVTRLRVGREVRPGKYTLRDHDYRRPANFPLIASAARGAELEQRLERFHYVPGAFLFRSEKGDPSPNADDFGKTRTDPEEGQRQAEKRLLAQRREARRVSLSTTALDLRPGVVMTTLGHPRNELAQPLLVTATRAQGSATGAWTQSVEARFTDLPYFPPLSTPKPRTQGVESATVVGPKGEEIHTDEFGRVRVHFHWDRESRMDERSSTWIHVSQSWGGSGFGGMNLPRVGQEVLVDFLGGDPDRPVVVGRVYTNLQRVPYGLPAAKTQSGWKSMSSPFRGSDAYNEIMFEDKAGKELLRIQAQRDKVELVKNDSTTTVKRDRRLVVERDDHTRVHRNQTLFVDQDRTVSVLGEERRVIDKDFLQTCREGSQIFRSKQIFVSEAEKAIVLNCGASWLIMTPQCIVVESPRTFINPGPEALLKALAGEAPDTPEDVQRRRDREDLDKNLAARRAEAEAMRKAFDSGRPGTVAGEDHARRQKRMEAYKKDTEDRTRKAMRARHPDRSQEWLDRVLERPQ